MSQLNRKTPENFTHENAPAKVINAEAQLRRTVMACLLWEGTFYEDGVSVAQRIQDLIPQVEPEKVAEIAIQARSEQRLRHVPLLLCRELARTGKLKADTLSQVIQRADELTEFLAIYWQDGKCALSSQVKKGLAKAFTKFDAYQLAKYNRDGKVKLRDALFLCHAKPKDKLQEANWKKLVDGTLEAPDTWEVGLSGGGDKKETFTRLLQENNLGYMALLRNLRNMHEVGVDEKLVFDALDKGAEKSKALPFRYISAANAVPQWEMPIDKAMLCAMKNLPKLRGKTILLVDISGSMRWSTAGKSNLTLLDAAAAMAALVAGVSERFEIYAFENNLHTVPSRQGLALVDAIKRLPSGGTFLGGAVNEMNKLDCDRLIVVTDEQSHDRVPDPKGKGYMVNVATNKNGVGYHKWTHIDGWSESIVRFIVESEAENLPE